MIVTVGSTIIIDKPGAQGGLLEADIILLHDPPEWTKQPMVAVAVVSASGGTPVRYMLARRDTPEVWRFLRAVEKTKVSRPGRKRVK